MTSSSQRTARAAGLVTGLALAALLVFAMRVPASDQPLGAGVRMEVLPPGELDAGADPVLLAANELVAGEERRGSLALTNITVGGVRVRLRVQARGHDLDDAVHLELRAGARRLASGPLGGLRTLRGFRLERGDTKTLRARAWIPRGAEGYEGRRARVSLTLRTELTGDRP